MPRTFTFYCTDCQKLTRHEIQKLVDRQEVYIYMTIFCHICRNEPFLVHYPLKEGTPNRNNVMRDP